MFVRLETMEFEHKQGYSHTLKVGYGNKHYTYCLFTNEVVILRDMLNNAFPESKYPRIHKGTGK